MIYAAGRIRVYYNELIFVVAARKKRLAEQAAGPPIDWDEVLADAEGEVHI
jgi:hypothetical protein